MMLLTGKRGGKVKGRMVFDGRRTREWITNEDSASPTATLEGIMLTLTIDAHENRDVMSADVPNAFIQTAMPEVKEGEERVMMKITVGKVQEKYEKSTRKVREKYVNIR